MKQYELSVGVDYLDEENILMTSLVENPATKKLFAVFSDESTEKHKFQVLPTRPNQQVVTPTDGKFERIISGVWFMPDTDYPRIRINEDGSSTTYTASMNKDELMLALKNFVKSRRMNQFDIMHNGESVAGLTTIETWMLYDHAMLSPVLLNSIEELGYTAQDIPVGTVFMTVFIENEQFFNDMILSGRVKGFSIEGLFNLSEKENVQSMEIETKNAALFSELGLSQSQGTLITKEGSLSIVNDEIKLDNKQIVNGSFKLGNKFSIEVREGRVVDFGFEEAAPVVVDSTTAEVEVSPVNEVPTVTTEDVAVEVETETEIKTEVNETKSTETQEVTVEDTGAEVTTEVKEDEVEVTTNVSDANVEALSAEIEALKAQLETERLA